jgi:hypothetical protein
VIAASKRAIFDERARIAQCGNTFASSQLATLVLTFDLVRATHGLGQLRPLRQFRE